MLNGNVFYHGIIRKTIVAFGKLFSDVYIDRREDNSVTGTVVQRLQIPLTYAPKEKWLVRLEQDPTLENNTYTSLPRMSFEITGYSYDSSRKLAKMNKIVCNKVTGSTSTSTSVFTPVPYNIDVSLYILTKTQEDAMQIIEQILPTFAPEYTMSIKAIDSMNIIQDIPITLNSVSVQDDYDGDFQTRRFVTHTLTFTLKVNLFGAVGTNNVIDQVDIAVSQEPTGPTTQSYQALGDVVTRVITESWTNEL